MTQVLSLMATHSDDRLQFSRLTSQSSNQNEEREIYATSPSAKPHIHIGSLYTGCVYVHFHRMQGMYILEN